MSGVDPAQWLGAQLDTDAAEIADPYGEKAWHARGCESVPDVLYPGRETGACDCGVPARALREIEAKREQVRLHGPSEFGTWVGDDDDQMPVCRTCGDLTARFPCRTLRLLASVYDDRPGYQEAWRP